ncbi:hypothetical protein ACUNWD_00830 [Sunxiuqinia sp. A32]|uniref:hypothetical protein n=1 Tax=Sunxiuqinia sp. A32 TaxID=3461496 RepID=UPI0040454FC8
MEKKILWHRMLYLSVGLITAVVLIITLVIIPIILFNHSQNTEPASAIVGFSLNIVFQLLIAYGLIWIVRIYKRTKEEKKELLIILGVGALIMGLFLSDAAFAFIDDSDMFFASVVIFICVALDFLASLFVFIARILWKRKLR